MHIILAACAAFVVSMLVINWLLAYIRYAPHRERMKEHKARMRAYGEYFKEQAAKQDKSE